MLYCIYRVIGTALYFLLLPALPVVLLFRPEAGRKLRMRLGGIRPEFEVKGRKTLWIHAASVGEVQAASVLITELQAGKRQYNILLTTMTGSGMQVAKTMLAARAHCILAPLDVAPAVRSYLGKVQPDIYIGLETELWPALLTELRREGVPGILLNGRMSNRSFARYRLLRGFMRELLSVFAAVAVIRKSDRERFAFFGIPEEHIRITGNLKYDFPEKDPAAVRKKYRTLLGLDGEKLFLCGSTRTGEEGILAGVFQQLRRQSGHDVVWLVAPRHLERLPGIGKMLSDLDLPFNLFTDLRDGSRKREHPVILLDTVGDLAEMYSAGDYIFCGGSLVDKGGHNVMEAARWGRPVYYGPHMHDFRDAAELLEKSGAGFRVSDAGELLGILLQHVRDEKAYSRAGRNALHVVRQQQGSARRQADMVHALLDEASIEQRE